MGIVGERPESGFRIDVERPSGHALPWRYEGHVVTPGARFGIESRVEADGAVSVQITGGEPAEIAALGELAEKVRLLLRAAVKHAREEGIDPPRRIVRWRPDR